MIENIIELIFHNIIVVMVDQIISIVTCLIGVIGIFVGLYQYRKTLKEEEKKAKRSRIEKMLTELYQPLFQLRRKSKLLYGQFNPDYKNPEKGFRTLDKLLDGHKFEGNQGSLLQEIVNIGKLCEDLIHEKAGLIDDKQLREVVFPRATTHFLILRLACERKLHGSKSDYKDLTFPRELDELLEQRINLLQNELESL